MNNRDPGDENDGPPPWRCTTGPTRCFYPRSWFEERVPPPPEHDPGDEEERWEPLSEVSVKRLKKQLGL